MNSVAIPLGQGQVFNRPYKTQRSYLKESQSLWVRDRFLMPVGIKFLSDGKSQSLWVRDSFLIKRVFKPIDRLVSQSLWVRDSFLMKRVLKPVDRLSRNPFGSGTVF